MTVEPPRDTALPDGFGVCVADDTKVMRQGRVLLGGASGRLLRLSAKAAEIVRAGHFTVRDPATRALARALLDAGVAHPRPPKNPADVTIVIPAHGRQSQVDRLVTALRRDPETARARVIVVDDASPVPLTGPEVIRHPRNAGPGSARNTGLALAETEFVAFCDSDVVPVAGWLGTLLAHFADPAVALAAPRIIALDRGDRSLLSRFERVRSPLDLGPGEGPIVPMSPVAYVPTATVVVRRSAVCAGFAPLRFGEDVDLCLRLYAAGWRSRYDPTARVAHDHRTRSRAWLKQRVQYGMGATPVAVRHPGWVAPLYAPAWSLAACLSLAAGRVVPAAMLTGMAAVRLARRLPDVDDPLATGTALALAGLRATAGQLATAAVRHHWPVAVALALVSKRMRWLLLAAVVVSGVREHRWTGSDLPVATHTAVSVVSDVSYGAGLWLGALRGRTTAALRPSLSGRRRLRH